MVCTQSINQVTAIAASEGMSYLWQLFPDAKAGELNFCLFSTSGVTGSYLLIEEAEKILADGGSEELPQITFLVIQPRICSLTKGNCRPKTVEDIEFLKKIRQSSQKAIAKIGYEE